MTTHAYRIQQAKFSSLRQNNSFSSGSMSVLECYRSVRCDVTMFRILRLVNDRPAADLQNECKYAASCVCRKSCSSGMQKLRVEAGAAASVPLDYLLCMTRAS